MLLLVSGIIGSSIFLTAKDIAGPLPQPMLFLLVWVIGGVISLFGCVAFAELGSMFPESGGQYVYLREAYGDLVAFLYGWMLFASPTAAPSPLSPSLPPPTPDKSSPSSRRST